jgi:hypothetical protein
MSEKERLYEVIREGITEFSTLRGLGFSLNTLNRYRLCALRRLNPSTHKGLPPNAFKNKKILLSEFLK